MSPNTILSMLSNTYGFCLPQYPLRKYEARTYWNQSKDHTRVQLTSIPHHSFQRVSKESLPLAQACSSSESSSWHVHRSKSNRNCSSSMYLGSTWPATRDRCAFDCEQSISKLAFCACCECRKRALCHRKDQQRGEQRFSDGNPSTWHLLHSWRHIQDAWYS